MDARLSRNGDKTRAPPSSAGRLSFGCGADRMVNIELEAAEALAGLAHSAMRERGSENLSGGESSWNGGESVSQQVKNESLADDSGINQEDSFPGSSDQDEDQAVMVQQQQQQQQQLHENMRNTTIKPVKAECGAELLKQTPLCATSHASSGGRKSRQNLTEDEKEARRLHRVLANRESARQTIRRRQAFHEELTRKAADLSWENENLKKEKELAMYEYDSLKSMNECLKAQMMQSVKPEVEETQEESKTTTAGSSTSYTDCPFLMYNQPTFMPFLWPSVILSPNSVQLQCGPHNSNVIPSKGPLQVSGRPNSFHEQENPLRISCPGTPLFMLPRPWYFPLPNHSNELHRESSSNLDRKENETHVNNQCSTSSYSKAHGENHHSSPTTKVKTEAFNSTEAMLANSLHETPFGFTPDGGGQHIGFFPKRTVLMAAPVNCVRPAVPVENENSLQPDCNPEPIASTDAHIASHPCRKRIEVVAAADARKRRKELTKLKNLHCQFRMHS